MTLVRQRRVESLRLLLTASLQAADGPKTVVSAPSDIEQNATEDISAAADSAAAAEISPSDGSPAATDYLRAVDSLTGQGHQAPTSEEAASEALEAENRRLRSALGRCRKANHILADRADQAQSQLARAILHRDLIVGAQLQKKDPRVAGFQNGEVLYKQRPETADEMHFRLFGTHEHVGPGPYNGSWIKWGQPFRYPDHAEVHAQLQREKAYKSRSERVVEAVLAEHRRQRAQASGT